MRRLPEVYEIVLENVCCFVVAYNLLLLLLLLLFTAIEFSLGGSSPYNSNK